MNTTKTWLLVGAAMLMVGLTGCASRDNETAAVPATQPATAATQPNEAPVVPVWSETVEGLRGRVVMSRDHVFNGTAIIVTKLELCNDGDQTLAFSWSWSRTKYIVADARGNKCPLYTGPFSGPGTFDSHVVIGPGQTVVVDMTSQGMGVGADLAAILCLGVVDDCWEFPSADTDYFLTATFTIPRQNKKGEDVKAWLGEKPPPAGSVAWYGQLNLPRVKIPLTPDPLPPNVGELIDQLGAAMVEEPWGEATDAMSLIDDERVIPWYVKLAATRDYDGKFEALDRLSRFDTDAALEGIKSCMNTQGEDLDRMSNPAVGKSSADAIRVSAAYALERCRHPQAKALLLTMQDDPYPSVRLIVLQAFTRATNESTPEVDEMIEKLTHDPAEIVREQAKEYQELRKNKKAMQP